MLTLTKRAVWTAAVAALAGKAAALRASAEATRAGATHEESRPENDKDTRALEASYLARGQAERVAETEAEVQRLRLLELRTFDADSPIGISALVTIAVDGEPRTLFLAPVGGGLEVCVDDQRIQVVNPASPVGRALLGKHAGDQFELRVGPRRRLYEIDTVR